LRDQRAARATGVEVTTVTLGARDLLGLAQFYARLLGLPVPSVEPEDDWVSIGGGEGWSLAIQLEPNQERATWPAAAGEQHMQIHLEIRADDLLAAQEHALACGATLASVQPQDDVRVMFDPEGHPFCLWVEEAQGN
jgi:catechol-2,3-dioxygenase